MKIVQEYNEAYVANKIAVSKAEYMGNFRIMISFADGTEKNVNFKSFLEQSNHPEIKKYLNEEKFLAFKITNGNIEWNDCDMIFPLSDLYSGKIS